MKLLGTEKVWNRIYRDWLHTGDDGDDRITTEIIEDVEPYFGRVKERAESQSQKSALRYKATIPFTLLDEAAKTNAVQWGVSVREAFSEIMNAKTDRAQKALRVLIDGRDYSKLQAKTYR